LFSLNLWLKKIATLKEREKRTICTDSVMCFMKEATIRLDPEREKEPRRGWVTWRKACHHRMFKHRVLCQ
jgi:hypothetical protein